MKNCKKSKTSNWRPILAHMPCAGDLNEPAGAPVGASYGIIDSAAKAKWFYTFLVAGLLLCYGQLVSQPSSPPAELSFSPLEKAEIHGPALQKSTVEGLTEDGFVREATVAEPENIPQSWKTVLSPRRIVERYWHKKIPFGGLSNSKTAALSAPQSSDELISMLNTHGLWDSTIKSQVPPVLIHGFPADLDDLDIDVKKKLFFHGLLPTIMVALDEVYAERAMLLAILDELGGERTSLRLSAKNSDWKDALSKEKVFFLKEVTKKYKTTSVAELLKRVNTVPVSLILAQGAIESSWGTSRFARLGNNLFGIWTWSENGIIPEKRDEGKLHRVAAYDTILDSVRAYILTINRVPAYEPFRDIRNQTMDSYQLVEGLLNYSERRDAYVSDLKQVIRYNSLKSFDACRLTSS